MFKEKLKVNEIISWIVRILLAFSIIENINSTEYQNIFVATVAFIITFYPSFLEKKFRVYLPSLLQIVITLFIFGSQFLGELHDFYYKIYWWDDMLHLISGSVLGIIGFMFVYCLNKTHIKNTKLSLFFITLFAFCFSITMGVFWEIFEFSGDRLFGLNMQKFRLPGENGLNDTMIDLIIDTTGALFVSLIGYFYMKDTKNILSVKINKWFKKQRNLEINMEKQKKS